MKQIRFSYLSNLSPFVGQSCDSKWCAVTNKSVLLHKKPKLYGISGKKVNIIESDVRVNKT